MYENTFNTKRKVSKLRILLRTDLSGVWGSRGEGYSQIPGPSHQGDFFVYEFDRFGDVAPF